MITMNKELVILEHSLSRTYQDQSRQLYESLVLTLPYGKPSCAMHCAAYTQRPRISSSLTSNFSSPCMQFILAGVALLMSRYIGGQTWHIVTSCL